MDNRSWSGLIKGLWIASERSCKPAERRAKDLTWNPSLHFTFSYWKLMICYTLESDLNWTCYTARNTCKFDTFMMCCRSSLQVSLAVHYLKLNPVNCQLNLHVVSLSRRIYFMLNDIFIKLNNPTNVHIIYYSRWKYFPQLIFVLLQK